MATTVESRTCPKCQTQYRTKVKKGRDTKSCPNGCQVTLRYTKLEPREIRGRGLLDITVAPEYISGVGPEGQYAWVDDAVKRFG